jgi:hypothetical protein
MYRYEEEQIEILLTALRAFRARFPREDDVD